MTEILLEALAAASEEQEQAISYPVQRVSTVVSHAMTAVQSHSNRVI